MAVSLNAGGYFRSDFMISDAAIPLRMEELQKEQTAEFSALLDSFGETESAGAAVVEQVKAQPTKGAVQLPEDAKQLVQMIAEGELKLEDLPKEFITSELLNELTQAEELEISETLAENPAQVKEFIPKPENDGEKPQVKQEITNEQLQLAAMFMQSGTDDKSAELSEITAVETVEEATEQVRTAQSIAPAEFVETAPTTEKKLSAEEPLRTTSDDGAFASAVKTAEQNAVKPVKADADYDSGVGENTQDASEGLFGAEQAKALVQAAKNGELSKPTVKTVSREVHDRQESVPEQTKPIMQERVKSAADELAMLKNAKVQTKSEVKATDERAADEVTPHETAQPLMSDTPIVLTRANGETVEVKPSEVIEQAAAKLVETAKTMTENETEYSLVLNPEELGRITVKMTKAADGAVSVTIAAENAKTQHILEQNSGVMQENLRSSGIQLESWQTVHESQQETYAQDYNGSSKNPYYREDNPPQNEQDAEETSFAELIASM